MTGDVSFFELGVEDTELGREFYGALFGWKFEKVTFDGGYAISLPVDGAPPMGGVHGREKGARPFLFFRVDNMEIAIERVVELGGTVADDELGNEESAARFGRFKLCRDNQGSPFGLHQPPVGTPTAS